MEQHPPLHRSVVAIEKGALGLPLTKVANFTYFIIKFGEFITTLKRKTK